MPNGTENVARREGIELDGFLPMKKGGLKEGARSEAVPFKR